MTCDEFTGLDEATRLAVIREILKQDNNPTGPREMHGDARRGRLPVPSRRHGQRGAVGLAAVSH